jgi:hypothetical protein
MTYNRALVDANLLVYAFYPSIPQYRLAQHEKRRAAEGFFLRFCCRRYREQGSSELKADTLR